MAPKRKNSLLDYPPNASSSEEEEVEEVEEQEHEVDEEVDEEEEEEEDDQEVEEEDDEVTPGKPTSSSAVSKPNSDDEEEDDESVKSDSELRSPKIKSLRPTRSSSSATGKPKKTVAKPLSTVKRALESEKDTKGKKKKVDDEDSHQEKSAKRSTFGPNSIFQRIWSEDDEIVVLKAMIESKKNGVDPMSNLSQFFESIKKSLQVEVRLEQLDNKIKRFRRKFNNNFRKAEGDADPVFSKPHDVLSYQLMKEIWGGKEGKIRGGGSAVTKNDSVVVNRNTRSKKPNNGGSPVRAKTLSDISTSELPNVDGSIGFLDHCMQELDSGTKNHNVVGRSFLKEGLDLIGDLKTKEFEQKWRSLHAEELKIYLKRLDLVKEQTVAILDAYKSSDAQEEHE